MARKSVDYNGESSRGTFLSYVVGFILSLELTVASYFLVVHKVIYGNGLIAAITCLAIAQLIVQLIFFLHLDRESKPRWNLTVFSFAALVLLILVFGSLWIMNNLNYHMTPHETNQYIQDEEGIHR